MLKTVSPPPEMARDDQPDVTDHSERRMRLALEALSGPADRSDPQPQLPRSDGGFRQDRGFDRGSGQRRDLRDTSASKARHRFVKDGEVPVVHMAPPRPRDAAAAPTRPEPDTVRLKEIIEDQRLRLEAAERAGREIQGQLRALQTKCAHTEMALADATALAESRLHELEALREDTRRAEEPSPPRPTATLDPAVPRRRGRPPGRTAAALAVAEPNPEHEPEPVQWWLQPTKATQKTRRRA